MTSPPSPFQVDHGKLGLFVQRYGSPHMIPVFTINRKPIGLQFEVTGSPENISILLARLDNEGPDLEYQILRDVAPESGRRKLVFRVADLIAYDILRDLITGTASLITDSPRVETDPMYILSDKLREVMAILVEHEARYTDSAKVDPITRKSITRLKTSVDNTLVCIVG